MTNQVTVSAPGKVILLGEHVVVYGYPALLTAINQRLYVTIKILNSKFSKKEESKIKIRSKVTSHLVNQAIKVFQQNFKIDKLPNLDINISSQIPIGSGLGSSAALSVSMIGALMKLLLNIWNPNKINDLAFQVEKIQHHNPSGADNTVVTFGGLIWYRKEFDFLKSIWSLPIINYKFPKILLIDSGKPVETTGEMVANVEKIYKKNIKKIEKIFQDQEHQTKKFLLTLKNGNLNLQKEAIIKGEENLEKIGVVGKLAKKIVKSIQEIGGAAKVCGGGGYQKGSGMILCFHHDLSQIFQLARKFELKVMPLTVGGEGVRIEKFSKSSYVKTN